MFKKTIRDSSIATLIGLVPHYLAFYLFGSGLLTEAIAEWIMKHTPSAAALWMLGNLGAWAKPFAVTGGLFTLGLCLWVPALLSYWRNRKFERFLILVVLTIPAIVMIQRYFEYHSALGSWAFWLPALLTLMIVGKPQLELIDEDWGEASEYAMQFVGKGKPRRHFLGDLGKLSLPLVMGGGVVAVAVESYLREMVSSKRAVESSQGAYQRMDGGRKTPVHTVCRIGNVMRRDGCILLEGVAFTGSRGIQCVEVRAEGGEWQRAEVESAYSLHSWVRYRAEIADNGRAGFVQARAKDGRGAWQSEKFVRMFPAGMAGPTIRKLTL